MKFLSLLVGGEGVDESKWNPNGIKRIGRCRLEIEDQVSLNLVNFDIIISVYHRSSQPH